LHIKNNQGAHCNELYEHIYASLGLQLSALDTVLVQPFPLFAAYLMWRHEVIREPPPDTPFFPLISTVPLLDWLAHYWLRFPKELFRPRHWEQIFVEAVSQYNSPLMFRQLFADALANSLHSTTGRVALLQGWIPTLLWHCYGHI
jgi:hypothetical protein